MSRPDLSVSIVSYNTREHLERCVASVLAAKPALDVEVIVVDNASSDGSVERIRERFPEVRVIANAENRFFTAANNQAFAVSTGRHVLILNSDVEVGAGALRTMVDYLDRHADAGAVTCRMVWPDGRLQRTCCAHAGVRTALLDFTFLRRLIPSVRQRDWDRVYYASWERDSDRDVVVAPDSCLMIRREVLDRVGPYDERFKLYYTENDLCERIGAAGLRVVFLAGAQVTHAESTSVRKAGVRRIRGIYRADMWEYYRRESGLLAAIVLMTAIHATHAVQDFAGFLGLYRQQGPI